MDLQRDFLGAEGGRMPVQAEGAIAVISAANALLNREALLQSILILMLNQFPATDRIANLFRKGAAVAGTPGGPNEDRDGGFQHGGWLVPYLDEKFGEIMTEWTKRA